MMSRRVTHSFCFCPKCWCSLSNRVRDVLRPWAGSVSVACPRCRASIITTSRFRSLRWHGWIAVGFLLLAIGVFRLLDQERATGLILSAFLVVCLVARFGTVVLENHRSHFLLSTAKVILWAWLLTGMGVVAVTCDPFDKYIGEKDDALVAKVDAGLKAGSFCGHREAVKAVSTLLKRGNPKATEAQVVDCLIATGASLLTDAAEWTNRVEAHEVYVVVKRYDDGTVIEGLVRKVISDPKNRLQVLFLGVKLGIRGSEERLNRVLDENGDKQMAEDFLNSSSSLLSAGGRRWANNHGYYISQGMVRFSQLCSRG
jgi:hypothetical protein